MKGIEMDYGKPERLLFLERERQDKKWNRITNALFWCVMLFLAVHIGIAMADTVVQTPDGRIVRCTVTNIGTIICL
jgi:hypothetical protein